MDYYSPFWGPKAISRVVEPQGALTCRSSTLATFVDYDPFDGLLLIEPQGALTCRSSTLIVLADSGPFHVLLLTVLVSRSGFHH